MSFSGRGNARMKLSFSGHIANKFRRPTILQLNIEGLTASKMNVLHHLAMQSGALVILLQETHCTDAEKLVLPNHQLAGSSLSRKHGLATFVHERLRYTLLDQSPPTMEIEGCVWTLMTIKYSMSTNHRQRDCEPWIFQCFLTPPSQHARAGPLRVKCGQCGLVRASQNRKGPVQVRCSCHEGKVQFSSGLSSIADVYRNRAVPVQFGK